jgi:filamentous hemagglutinin family protein
MKRHIFCAMALSLFISSSFAEIVLDGTLGPVGTLTGPNFVIDAQLGQSRGNNLFHSFQSFNINQAQSATFTGPLGIQNVISRVTGGQPSLIDGLLSLKIPEANLYFLNPAGIIFGPNAKLDIPASLYLSTADYLKLADGGLFDASQPDNTLLTVAPPAAFGFLTHHPGSIRFENSQLVLPNNEMLGKISRGEEFATTTLSLIGGDIFIKNGQIVTYGNDAHLVSVASPGDVPMVSSQLTDNSFTAYGTLSITHDTSMRTFGNLDASGFGGGAIFIRVGQMLLNNARIFADTFGHQNGRGITIHTTETLVLENGSRITTESYQTQISPNQVTGSAGPITIEANALTMNNGSQITSTSQTAGQAGNINVSVQETLSLAGMNINKKIPSAITSDSYASGSAGNITISANRLVMNEDAQIRAFTQGLGKAGNIYLGIRTLNMQSGAQINVSVGDPLHLQGIHQGGTLTIDATDSVFITGRSNRFNISTGLFSNTFMQGTGGTIKINAFDLTVEKGASIQAVTTRNGNAGHITLNVDTLNLTEAGTMSTNTLFGQGQGGTITITARQQLNIDGQGSGIAVTTNENSQGAGGYIDIQAFELCINNGGGISAHSEGQGNAGGIILRLGDKLLMNQGTITTSATSADGGNIQITAPHYFYLVNSEITTSVGTGFGGGGNVTLNPEFVIQDHSPIIAQAYGGPGGNIQLTTTGIYQFPPAETSPIDASSQLGIDGEILIRLPDVDGLESFFALPSQFKDHSGLLKSCGARDIENPSTFKVFTLPKNRRIAPDSVYSNF